MSIARRKGAGTREVEKSRRVWTPNDDRVDKILSIGKSKATALIYQWVKTGVISKSEFEELLAVYVDTYRSGYTL